MPRIASLVPSLTELLFAIDLDDQVVARTGFCIHPRDKVRSIPKVGGTKDVDVDSLLAAEPTHLIVNIDENRKETIKMLRPRIPEIVVTHPLVPDDNLDLFREFGRLFDRQHAAAALAKEFEAARDELREGAANTKPLSVLYLIWKDPWFTVSRETYVSAMLASANLMTIPETTTERYPKLSNDDGAWNQADAILLSSEPYAFRRKHVDELAATLTTTKPILLADGELISWYGPRAILGLRYLLTLRAEVDATITSPASIPPSPRSSSGSPG